jgi:hypothetical protein
LDGAGEFEMRGRVESGFFNCGKLLLKQTKLTLILTKNEDSFSILGNKDFRFKFVNASQILLILCFLSFNMRQNLSVPFDFAQNREIYQYPCDFIDYSLFLKLNY